MKFSGRFREAAQVLLHVLQPHFYIVSQDLPLEPRTESQWKSPATQLKQAWVLQYYPYSGTRESNIKNARQVHGDEVRGV